MKTMKFTKQVFSLIFIASLFLACSKEDGQDGATGPSGPQGEQGVTGADGEQGEQGETGTANVIFSDWITVDYLLDGALESNFQGLKTFNESELNKDTDVVLVYGQRENGSLADGVYALPYILASQDEYYSFMLTEASGITTSLRATVNTLDGGTNLFNFFQQYRYVIIPGGISDSGKSSINYNKMTYEEVAAHFGIED
jgi:hypothetical protein